MTSNETFPELCGTHRMTSVKTFVEANRRVLVNHPHATPRGVEGGYVWEEAGMPLAEMYLTQRKAWMFRMRKEDKGR